LEHCSWGQIAKRGAGGRQSLGAVIGLERKHEMENNRIRSPQNQRIFLKGCIIATKEVFKERMWPVMSIQRTVSQNACGSENIHIRITKGTLRIQIPRSWSHVGQSLWLWSQNCWFTRDSDAYIE
jgi:hypothetical protein